MADPQQRDEMGNTRLMVLVASQSPSEAQLSKLLAAQRLAVNTQDAESGYTAMHKCLYRGNLVAALHMLRARPDIDLSVRDKEGLTCLDLLNATMKLPRMLAPRHPGARSLSPIKRSDRHMEASSDSDSESMFDTDDEHNGFGNPSESRSPLRHEGSAQLSPSRSVPRNLSAASYDLLGGAGAHADGGDAADDGADPSSPTRSHRGRSPTRRSPRGSKSSELLRDKTASCAIASVAAAAAGTDAAMSVWSWGSNNNFVLGFPNSGDRTYPERLDLTSTLISQRRRSLQSNSVSLETLSDFDPRIEQVAMSKYHACILTGKRLYTHGFGPGGRLGLGHEETMMRPTEVPQLSGRARFVAVGPDHTIAISDDGGLWTWGSNEYSQLGYPVESTGRGPPRQLFPQLIALKKIYFSGAAAAKFHSVAFTSSGSLYTWGTNQGQLGYDQAVQPTPRKVTSFPQQAILQVSATNGSTAVLVATNEVFVFAQSTCTKVMFPKPSVPNIVSRHTSSMQRQQHVLKIVSGNHQYATLMSSGDVFLWTPPAPPGTAVRDPWQQTNFPMRRPRIVWSVRRKHLAARDVAIGIDSSIVIGTDSGHVFLGTRRQQGPQPASPAQPQQVQSLAAKERSVYVSPRVAAAIASSGSPAKQASAPPPGAGDTTAPAAAGSFSSAGLSSTDPAVFFKYTKVPNLQHIVMVVASIGGAFAAVRSDRRPALAPVPPSTLAADMRAALFPQPPFFNLCKHHEFKSIGYSPEKSAGAAAKERFLAAILPGVPEDVALSGVVELGREPAEQQLDDIPRPVGLGDVVFVTEGGTRISAHRIVLAARSTVFRNLLLSVGETPSGDALAAQTAPRKSKGQQKGKPAARPGADVIPIVPEPLDDGSIMISIPTVHPAALVCILEFIYTGRFKKQWTTASLLSASAAAAAAASSAGAAGTAANRQSTSTQSKKDRSRQAAINPQDLFGTRIYHEFTRLARALRLDDTEILHASMEPGALISTSDRLREAYTLVHESLMDTLTDVVIRLAGGETVRAHRIMLAARSPFFSALLGPRSAWARSEHGDEDLGDQGTLSKAAVVGLEHIKRPVFELALQWMYTDASQRALFSETAHETPSDFIAFVLDVLAAANEMLLEPLKRICGDVLFRITDIKNVVAILEIADMYNVEALKAACLEFVCWNLETFIENHGLEDVDLALLGDVEARMRVLQTAKFPHLFGDRGFYTRLRQITAKYEHEQREKRRVAAEQRKLEKQQRSSSKTRDVPGIDLQERLAVPLSPSVSPVSSSPYVESFGPLSTPQTGTRVGSLESMATDSFAGRASPYATTPSLRSPLFRATKTSSESLRSLAASGAASANASGIPMSPVQTAGTEGQVEDGVFSIDMEAEAHPTKRASQLRGPHDSPRSAAVGASQDAGTPSKAARPPLARLEMLDRLAELMLDPPEVSPSPPVAAVSPSYKAWSPATNPQEVRGKPSLRDIMNEAREQARAASETSRPPVPSAIRRSPGLPPSNAFSPRVAAAAAAPVSQSPFFLGEPLEPLTKSVSSTSSGTGAAKNKLSQKQRKMQAAAAAAAAANSVGSGTLAPGTGPASALQPPTSSSAWPAAPASFTSKAAAATPPTASAASASEGPAWAEKITAQGPATPIKSLRQIQEEEEMFKRKQPQQPKETRASLLSPKIARTEARPKSSSGSASAASGGAVTVPIGVFLGAQQPKQAAPSAGWTGWNVPSPASSPAQPGVNAAAAPASFSSAPARPSPQRPSGLGNASVATAKTQPAPGGQRDKLRPTVPSFSSIQDEQKAQVLARTKVLKKPLGRIQLEERAVQDLAAFYAMTRASGTGEWIRITHVA
ncbi:hypothetical protein HK105_208243 [Polyrhizophydium stewartii]|uniref:BTB domain-containing protein n=1 Tax=Polyrhizophydium stewartii TaxID=2732419 RepID=A0ABR4MY75_9FUNG